ncbi:MAG: hypothetical protein HY721_23550 [Planctomycetes bacterium]|nr:hypothetical protein [Planctomycetota bacterium]
MIAGLAALCAGCTTGQTDSPGPQIPARTEGDSYSLRPSISDDGRLVAFESYGSNLVERDSNRAVDVFVHERSTGRTERVSVDSAGRQGDDNSWLARISGDGTVVAFVSQATNLVPGDTNATGDVFVHELESRRTLRVSVGPSSRQGDGHCRDPAPSRDGRFVAFSSMATNLVEGDGNACSDIFVHDRRTGETGRVSVAPGGGEANAGSTSPRISGDGNVIVFLSHATNLVPDDSNRQLDVFVHDRRQRSTVRVSVDSSGREADGHSDNPVISGDGRYVAFESWAGNLAEGDANRLPDVFVHDIGRHTTELASRTAGGAAANGQSRLPALSADGRFLAFTTWATDLASRRASNFSAILILDRETGRLESLTLAPSGEEANHDSSQGALSADGSLVVFPSKASNLVSGDSNGEADIFVHDLRTSGTSRVSVGLPSRR